MKKIVLGISGGISFLIFLILLFTTNYLGQSQLTQTAASRWSDRKNASQVSCFFSVGSGITEDAIIDFEHTVDNALTDASVVQESENPGARLWADAYSADGTVNISTDRANIEADAIGIGGDFFLFHPVKLLYGAYFSGNDLMQDYCVIDEDAAWQLFGSNNVAGMMVYIGGVPHIVTGVVERPAGHLAEAAGLDSTLVYVSYQTLNELGQNHGINHYEIVMPNPVTGFAVNYIREKLGTEEKETEIVENTTRYSLLSRLKLLTQFGVRSMNGKAIIYPYWENIARGYEDILAVMTLFGLLFLAYPVGLALVFFCIWWKHKGWTMRDVRLKLMDLAERWVERQREKRKGRKRKKKDGYDGFEAEEYESADPEEDEIEEIEFEDDVNWEEPEQEKRRGGRHGLSKEASESPSDEKHRDKERRKQEKQEEKRGKKLQRQQEKDRKKREKLQEKERKRQEKQQKKQKG